MTQHILKATFTRGELSPLTFARQDIDTYLQGAEAIDNFSVLKYGGLRRRSGTYFRGATKRSDLPCRMWPYVYSNDQAYLLELGHNYIRFWNPDGAILNGDIPYELITDYTSAEINDMQLVAVNDVIFIAHPNHPPRQLSRYGDTNWTLTDCTFNDGPYFPINTDPLAVLTVTGSPTSNADVTFVWATGVALVALDVGRTVRAQFRGRWVWGRITSVLSPLSCNVHIVGGADDNDPDNITDDDGDGSKTDADDDIVPSGTTSRSWRLANIVPAHPDYRPACVEVTGGRVVWARTRKQPRAVIFSMSDYIDKYSPSDQDGTVADNHGFVLDILTGGADPIAWLKNAYNLEVGSGSGIRTISNGQSSGSPTPRDVNVRLEVPFGANNAQPVQIGPSTLYIDRSGTRLHDMVYDYQVRGLTAPTISIMSEHLFRSGVTQVAYQDAPDSILWMLTTDGRLIGTTFERYEKVIGFHRHSMDGIVESIAVMPNGTYDELWLVVRRTINGQTVRYVETLEQSFDGGDKTDAMFVDCGRKYSAVSPVTVVTGLAHLEGATVSILADGAVLPNTTVVGGKITLPNGASARKISVGLPIVARVKLLRTPANSKDGVVFTRRARIAYVDIDVYETGGLKSVSNTGQVDTMQFRPPTSPMNSGPDLISGSFRMLVDGSWRSEGQIELVCDEPLPCTIRALLVALDPEP